MRAPDRARSRAVAPDGRASWASADDLRRRSRPDRAGYRRGASERNVCRRRLGARLRLGSVAARVRFTAVEELDVAHGGEILPRPAVARDLSESEFARERDHAV